MNLKLKTPLSFFDLETTGTNVIHDRIVEISIYKAKPNGENETLTLKINPTIPIPHEVSLIHGIYEEDIKDAPTFKDVAKDIYKFLEGSDLAGYNMLKFDLPLLSEEFYRVDINFDVSKRKLVDAQKIFHLMEKRTLSAAYEFYCNKSLEDAHSAEADTFATYEVLKAQVEKYDGKDVVDGLGKVLGKIENNIEKLHEITASNIVDFAGRLVYNAQGEEIFNFGKHKGKTVQNVLQIEPQYYDWIMNSDFPMDTKRKLTQIKLRNFQK